VRRRVGLLGHAGFLYHDLTAVENVRFAARAAGRTTGEADAALARLGLDGTPGDTPVGLLSAGQRRRTAVAAVVARGPDLWLLDEPHAGLDADGRDLLEALVRESAAGGAAVLMASHELERSQALAGRSLAMAGGRVQAPPGTSPLDRPPRERAGVA
jgi:ABC-type transport system involved in cytochrome c biogenesis ATPase subunit